MGCFGDGKWNGVVGRWEELHGIAWYCVIKPRGVLLSFGWVSVIGAAPIWRWPSWFGALHQLQMSTVSWRENCLRFQTISGGAAFSCLKSWVSNCCSGIRVQTTKWWLHAHLRQHFSTAEKNQALAFQWRCFQDAFPQNDSDSLEFSTFTLANRPCKFRREGSRLAVFCRCFLFRIGLCKVAPRGLPYSVLHLGNTCAAHQMFSHTVTQLSTKISLDLFLNSLENASLSPFLKDHLLGCFKKWPIWFHRLSER